MKHLKRMVGSALSSPIVWHAWFVMLLLASCFAPMSFSGNAASGTLGTVLIAWFVLTTIGFVASVVWLLRTGVRQQRRMQGRCPRCAYDLSNTPMTEGSLHCPECGSVWKNSAEWVNTEPPNRRGGSDS